MISSRDETDLQLPHDWPVSGLQCDGTRSLRLRESCQRTVDNLVLEDEAGPGHHLCCWPRHGHQAGPHHGGELRPRGGRRDLRPAEAVRWRLLRSDGPAVLHDTRPRHSHKLLKLRLPVPDSNHLLLLLLLLLLLRWRSGYCDAARLGVDDGLAAD